MKEQIWPFLGVPIGGFVMRPVLFKFLGVRLVGFILHVTSRHNEHLYEFLCSAV